MSEEKKKPVFEVLLIRVDGNEIPLMQTQNYDEAFEKWAELSDHWEEAGKEQKPFRIKEPIVTSFNPGLVSEILLRPIVEQSASKYNNPYQKAMNENGFSQTFGNHGMMSDIKDGGYS